MIAVVVPAYNEEKMIKVVLRSLKPYADEIIVVDDGSTDATSSLALTEGVYVLRHLVNRDYGAAIATGTAFALSLGADIIVHFDADGQFEPAEVKLLLEPLLQDKADVVLGSRFLGKAIGMPWHRKLIQKGAVLFTWFFSGIKLTDAHNGFRAFTRKALQQITLSQDHKALTSEILHEISRSSLRYLEVPVTVHYTNYSLHKAKANSVWDIGRIIRDLLIGKFVK